MEYKLLMLETQKLLNEAVNYHLGLGWKLYGNPVIVWPIDIPIPLVAQAMTLSIEIKGE